MPDPTAFEGTDEDKVRLFAAPAVTLGRRIDPMLSVPVSSLDAMPIQRENNSIGAR